MSNSKSFPLPSGDVAVGIVPIDPATGYPLYSRLLRQVRVLGKCSDLDNALRDTWDGPTPLYVFPTAPMQMQIASTSVDDAAAGTGLRTVEIYYLDADYAEHVETITLNGTTPVLTVATNILRVNQMHAATVGSGTIAAGTVSLTAVGGAVTYSTIPVGRNYSRQAIYTVPAGYMFDLEQWQVSSGSTGAHFCQHTLVATCDEADVHAGVFLPKDEQGTQNGGMVVNYPFAFESFPARTDIKVAIISDGASANVVALTAFFGRLRPVST